MAAAPTVAGLLAADGPGRRMERREHGCRRCRRGRRSCDQPVGLAAWAGRCAETDGGICPTVVAKGRRSRKRTGQRQPLEEEALGASACEACEHGMCFTCELKVILESIRAQAYASAHMANKPRQRFRTAMQGKCEKMAGLVAQMRAQQAEQFDSAACEALLAEIELCLMC